MTIKQSIISLLTVNLNSGSKIIKRFREDDLGPYFGTIYYWQEIKKHAESALETSWKLAQKSKVIPDDDDLRDLGAGEHIIADSKQFSFIAKVDRPRQNFDPEQFIQLVAKRYKLSAPDLTKMAAGCLKDSKPPLTKRILEVEK